MSNVTVQQLADDLGLDHAALDGLEAVPATEVEALRGLVAEAVAAEDALVSDSLDAAIDALPRPLRGRARGLLLEHS